MSKSNENISVIPHQSIHTADSHQFEATNDEKMSNTIEKGRSRIDEDYSFSEGDENFQGGWRPTEEQKVIQKRMKRKFDCTLLPILTIIYLFNALDKGNLGNAKTGTLEKDLNLKGDQYYLITMIF